MNKLTIAKMPERSSFTSKYRISVIATMAKNAAISAQNIPGDL